MFRVMFACVQWLYCEEINEYGVLFCLKYVRVLV